MKKKLLLTIFLISGIAQIYANPTIYKTWIGEDLQYLELNKKHARYGSILLWKYKVRYKDSILTFTDPLWATGDFFKQRDKFVFKVVFFSKDTLVLIPLNKNASRLVGTKKSCIFTSKKALYKPKLKFQKVYFSLVSYGFSSSSAMEIEIDSVGTVHYNDSLGVDNLSGFYKGQLSAAQLDSLTLILKMSELDRFPKGLGCGYDGTDYAFRFYYDNKLRKCEGCQVPYFHRILLRFLTLLPKNIEFKRIKGEYKFVK